MALQLNSDHLFDTAKVDPLQVAQSFEVFSSFLDVAPERLLADVHPS